MRIELPYPPTINHYYERARGNKTIVSKRGKRFREEVALACRSAPTLHGKLRVVAEAYPPDHRTRDLDNLLKPLLDALELAGVYANDGNIDQLQIRRMHCTGDGVGKLTVEITEAIRWRHLYDFEVVDAVGIHACGGTTELAPEDIAEMAFCVGEVRNGSQWFMRFGESPFFYAVVATIEGETEL